MCSNPERPKSASTPAAKTGAMTIVRMADARDVFGSSPVETGVVPASVMIIGETGRRVRLGSFAAQIRNRNTRQANARSASAVQRARGVRNPRRRRHRAGPLRGAAGGPNARSLASDGQAGADRGPAPLRPADGPSGGFHHRRPPPSAVRSTRFTAGRRQTFPPPNAAASCGPSWWRPSEVFVTAS